MYSRQYILTKKKCRIIQKVTKKWFRCNRVHLAQICDVWDTLLAEQSNSCEETLLEIWNWSATSLFKARVACKVDFINKMSLCAWSDGLSFCMNVLCHLSWYTQWSLVKAWSSSESMKHLCHSRSAQFELSLVLNLLHNGSLISKQEQLKFSQVQKKLNLTLELRPCPQRGIHS